MEKKNNILLENPLFKDFTEDEIKSFLEEINAYKRTYKKDECIYLIGDKVDSVGIILSGKVTIENYDDSGNKVIFALFEKGEHLGDSYALTGFPIMVDVTAAEESELLFINTNSLVNEKNLSYTSMKIFCNLIKILAKKNMTLSRKIRNTSHKTIRTKIMSYLKEESIIKNKTEFDIPYDRQSLANYLNCDRSQLSKELSKMRKEKIIEYSKNHFKIFF